MKNEFIVQKFEAYLLTEQRVALNTLSAYKHDIGQLVAFLKSKNGSLHQASSADLKKFLAFLHEHKLSARTMARKISSLKTFFKYVHQQFQIPNPTADLRIPKLEKKLPRYLSETDIEKLFLVAQQANSTHILRNMVMLYLLYTSGMRISELIKLRIGDFHFDTGFIAVVGKGGKHRMVPIPQGVMLLVKKYIDALCPKVVGDKPKNFSAAQYIFAVKYGGKLKPISRQSFWIILQDLWRKTGIKRRISPHQLRHSLATHMLKQGVDLRSLQLILGHENLSTVQIYTHIEKGYVRNVYDDKHLRS